MTLAEPVAESALASVRAWLGGRPVKVFAPVLGAGTATWAEAFAADFPAGVSQLIGLDVETRYMTGANQWAPQWRCRTIQLAPDDDSAWVLRLDDLDQAMAAAAVLDDEAKTFTSHTQTDPHAVLVALDADIMGRYLDTHPLAVMTQPDDRQGQADLKSVTTRLGMPELAAADQELDQRFDELYRAAHPEIGRRAVARTKREQLGFDTIDLGDPIFVRYAGLDAVAVRRVAPALIKTLGDMGTPGHLVLNERWLSEQVTRAKARGLRIDLERLDAMETRTAAAVRQATIELGEINGLRPTQGVKLVQWFGEHIAGGWPADHPRTQGQAPSLGDGAHHRLGQYDLDEAATGALAAYSRWQEVSNQATLAAQVRAALDPRGFIHPTVYSVGTITSRMSSAGPNTQNWAKPKDLDDANRAQRELVVPDDYDTEADEVFISCDFSQVEYRGAAAFSGEQSLIDTIKAGGNLHQLTADRLTEQLGVEVPYYIAKPTNFSVLYGVGGAKLAKILNYRITEEAGKDIVRAYWAMYPALDRLREQMMAQDGVRLLSGRWVPTGTITKGERAGTRTVWANLNYLIQGNCRELLVGAWIQVKRIFDAHPQWRAMVRLPVHDELVVSCRRQYAAQVCAALEACMTFDFLGVPIEAEADVLLDEADDSRWMSGDIARKIRVARAA